MHVLLVSLFIIVNNSCIIYMVGPASPRRFAGLFNCVNHPWEYCGVESIGGPQCCLSQWCDGVCTLQKTNNDAWMGQATIANICEQEHWVGPAFIFRLLNADTLTWQHASMFDSGWVLLTVLRLQIISSVSKVYGILHYINSCH